MGNNNNRGDGLQKPGEVRSVEGEDVDCVTGGLKEEEISDLAAPAAMILFDFASPTR